MGNEGYLTLTIKARVRPEPCAIELMRKYKMALQYAVNWILDRSTVVQAGKRVKYFVPKVSEVHRGLYETLKNVYGLPAKVAQDCYRNALAIAKSWLGNGAKGRRPTIKRVAIWLTPRHSYRIRNDYVELASNCQMKIIGADKRYAENEYKEARLAQCGNDLCLYIFVRIPRTQPYSPKGVVAVDVNKRYIYFGNLQNVSRVPTAIKRAERWRLLGERLYQKYSWPKYMAWIRRRKVLHRIRHFYRRARNIIEDWARKVAVLIVSKAHSCQAAIAVENLRGLKTRLEKTAYRHRRAATWMAYRKLDWWINWQATKRGVPVVVVDPRDTSSTCPRCGTKLVEVGYRYMRCPSCGFEGDRDVIAVVNIEKRALAQMGGILVSPTAPQMTDVTTNRCGEPMKRPGHS